MLVGGQFNFRKEPLFSGADYYFDELDAWFGRLVVDRGREMTADKSEVIIRRVTRPAEVEVEIPSHAARLTLFTELSEGGADFQSLRMVQRAAIRFESEEPRPLDWFMDRMGDLRALLSLLMGEADTPSRMVVWPPASGSTECPSHVEEALNRADVCFSVVGDRRTRRLHPAFMLFTYDQIGERFGDIVRDWFAMREQLLPVVALFSGTVYTTDLPGEFRFLALTQALETLHRRTFKGLYVDPGRYEAIAGQLVDAIHADAPKDLRQALEARIGFGNEYAQRRRFAELWESLDHGPRLRVMPDKRFLERVVAERNYLTHLPAEGNPSMTPWELFGVSMRLRAFLLALLIAKLGLADPEVSKGFARLRWFRGYVG